jgi:hypothetical protein
MNLQDVARKHKVSDNFLQSKEDGLSIGATSIDDLIFQIKKGTLEPEQLIYKLQQLRNFMVDVRTSTF